MGLKKIGASYMFSDLGIVKTTFPSSQIFLSKSGHFELPST